MSDALAEVLAKLTGVVEKIQDRLDKLEKPVEETPKRRGRPKKAAAKPTKKPVKAAKKVAPKKVKPPEEEAFEEFEVEEDDDDVAEFNGNEKRLAMASGIQRGKTQNTFDPKQYESAAAGSADDKKAMRLLKQGKLKISPRRAPEKMKIVKCSSCHKKYKIAEKAIIVNSVDGEGSKWKCNNCSGGA